MPVVLVTIDSDWSVPSATPRTACSATDGERAVSVSKQVLAHTGADSSSSMHLSTLEMSLPLWSRRFLLIDRPPVRAFTKIDTMNHQGMQGSRAPSWRVLVDFDGTTDRLFECFTDPARRAVETAWQGGETSSRECLERQAALLLLTPEALDEQSRTVRIAPGFPAFIEFCRDASTRTGLGSRRLSRCRFRDENLA
jgi:hypothetical protein